MVVLQHFDFPGNVRQLENFCHWLTVMAPGQTVNVSDLPPEIKPFESVPRTPTEPLSAPPDLSVHAVTPLAMTAPAFSVHGWAELLAEDASKRLQHTDPEVWGALTREFEKRCFKLRCRFAAGVVLKRRPDWGWAATRSRESCVSWAWTAIKTLPRLLKAG